VPRLLRRQWNTDISLLNIFYQSSLFNTSRREIGFSLHISPQEFLQVLEWHTDILLREFSRPLMDSESERFMYSMQPVITTDNISDWVKIILWWNKKFGAALPTLVERMDNQDLRLGSASVQKNTKRVQEEGKRYEALMARQNKLPSSKISLKLPLTEKIIWSNGPCVVKTFICFSNCLLIQTISTHGTLPTSVFLIPCHLHSCSLRQNSAFGYTSGNAVAFLHTNVSIMKSKIWPKTQEQFLYVFVLMCQQSVTNILSEV